MLQHIKVLNVIRWIAAPTAFLVCISLIRTAPESAFAIRSHALALVAIALAIYTWTVYESALVAVSVSVAVLLSLAWVLAARAATGLGIDMAALVFLLGAVLWQMRKRRRRLQRMLQAVDDLDEERAVKDQAIAHTRESLDALKHKFSRYAKLQTIAEELSRITEPSEIAQLAVEHVSSLIGKAEVCLLFIVDKERQELALMASKKRGHITNVRAKHGDQFDRHVLRTQRPLLVTDVRRDFRFTTRISRERDISAVIACPLLLGQSAEGVLRLDSAKPGAFNQDDLRFLDIFLNLVATAMVNARLFAETKRLAVTDSLTGLSLRRPFLDQLARELSRAGRSREPVSLIILDVDRFKDYNDTYGHSAGDIVLRSIAEVIGSSIPPDGLGVRFGGEEFAVLLPRSSRLQASDLAELIRARVEERVQVPGKGNEKPVTISLGVASCPDDASSELELIRIADERLYQAKRGGRNIVCAA